VTGKKRTAKKPFSRFGDMTSVAVLQSLNEDEMTNPQTLRDILSIIRFAFDCPSRCVVVSDDRRPEGHFALARSAA